MFSNLDRDGYAKLARIAGIVLFVVSFFLPAVTNSYPQSFRDYLITSGAYPGFACVLWSLAATPGFITHLSDSGGSEGGMFFFMISGWITPLTALGIFINGGRVKRALAIAIPFLLIAPWFVFAWPDDSGWGSVTTRPLIGHYVWTLGCLLIFAPEYMRMLGAAKEKGDGAADAESSSDDGVA